MQSIDAIIILGGGVGENGEILSSTKERLDELLKNKIFYGLPVILSGRRGFMMDYIPPITEARAMKKYLQAAGWRSKIFIEEKSLDTIGNAYFSKQIADKFGWRKILIITSDYHIKRSRWIFKKIFGAGYKLKFLPTPSGKFQERQEKEKRTLVLTKKIFGKMNPENFSLADHPFYSKTAKAKEILAEIIAKKL